MMAPKRTPLPRRSPEDRKQLIIEAATEVLSDRQYEDVPVSEIVKKAGVAQGTFYLYFPTKTAILHAIGERVMGILDRQLAKIAEEEATVIDVVREMHRFALKTVRRFSGIMPLLDSDKMFFAKHGRTPQEPPAMVFHTLERLIRRDQERGRIDSTLDPQLTARLIVSVIDRFMRDMRKGDEFAKADAYSEQMMHFLKGALRFKEQ